MRDRLTNFARDLHLPRPPFWMVAIALFLIVGSWVPLALIARERVTIKREPRVHIFQDMDSQPKLNTQDYTVLFEDRRAMRPPVPGTVARGELNENEVLVKGFTLAAGPDGKPAPQYVAQIPPEVKVDDALLKRGQVEYNVYCAPCHGLDGRGEGPVHVRAARIQGGGNSLGTTWVQPSNLHGVNEQGQLTFGRDTYPDGKLYSVITNGIRNMPAYGHQVKGEDRWAIVAYVRALQASQNAPAEMVPQEQRAAVQE